jgi:hypothetical protein
MYLRQLFSEVGDLVAFLERNDQKPLVPMFVRAFRKEWRYLQSGHECLMTYRHDRWRMTGPGTPQQLGERILDRTGGGIPVSVYWFNRAEQYFINEPVEEKPEIVN